MITSNTNNNNDHNANTHIILITKTNRPTWASAGTASRARNAHVDDCVCMYGVMCVYIYIYI